MITKCVCIKDFNIYKIGSIFSCSIDNDAPYVYIRGDRGFQMEESDIFNSYFLTIDDYRNYLIDNILSDGL